MLEDKQTTIYELAEGKFDEPDLMLKMMRFYNAQNNMRITSGEGLGVPANYQPNLHCLLTEGGETKWDCLLWVYGLAKAIRHPEAGDEWIASMVKWTISALHSRKTHVGDVDAWIDDRINMIKTKLKAWKPNLSDQIDSF